MKKSVCLLGLLLLLGCAAQAQDIIVLKSADEIKAKIKEILPTTIKYVEWDFQDGPDRIMDKNDILVIKYQNGRTESFENTARARRAASVGSSKEKVRTYINEIKLQGYVYTGLSFADGISGPVLEGSVGARLYDYLYLGAELGYRPMFVRYYASQWGADRSLLHDVHLGVNMKCYIPAAEKIYPYMNLSMGFHYFNQLPMFGMQFGTGFDFGHFSVGIGYERLQPVGSFGYIKFGVVF